MLIVTVTALILLVLFIKWLWDRRRLYLLSLKMPGPISFPFIGSLIDLLLAPSGNLSWIQTLETRFGPTCRVWVGPLLHVLVTKAEHIESVLSSVDCINRADLSKTILLDAIGAESVFSLEDELWKKSRRIVGPSFNYSVVVTYLPIFNKQAMYCVDQLRKYLGSGTFNIRPIVEEATVFSFVHSTLDRDITEESMRRYAELVSKRQKLIQIRLNQPFYQSKFIWNLSKYAREAIQLDKKIEKLKDDIIRPIFGSSGTITNTTFLQRLLRKVDDENDHLSINEIIAEVTAVMLSGTESTAGPISITLLLLAMHPEVQEKVIGELRRVLPDQKSIVTKEDLEKMHFLDMCVREELRLFPSVPVTMRKNKKAIQLDDYTIPSDTAIVISFHQLQRNPIYWGPNADKFDPNRFLPENAHKIVPCSYIPFGTGTRGCIGNTYAMTVIKTFLATILRNYKVTTHMKIEELTADSAITIIVNDAAHMMRLEERDY